MLRRTNDVIDCTDEAFKTICRDCEGCISIESLGPEFPPELDNILRLFPLTSGGAHQDHNPRLLQRPSLTHITQAEQGDLEEYFSQLKI